MSLNPITREEKFLAKAGGEDVGELKPITRREQFLAKLAGGGSGGGSVSWYDLKDRPFYSNGVELITILENLELAEVDGQFAYASAVEGIEVGKEYTIKYNGVDYVCTAKAGTTVDGFAVTYFGNGDAMGFDGGAEPFMVIIFPPEATAMVGIGMGVIPLDGATTVSISIYGEKEDIKKLDNKFLDLEWLPTSKPSWISVIKDHLIGFIGMYYDATNASERFDLKAGSEYTVIWNGVEYKAKAFSGSKWDEAGDKYNYVLLGGWIVDSEGQTLTKFDEYPFAIYYSIGESTGSEEFSYLKSTDTKENVEITIKELVLKAEPLPEKFLPAGVGGGIKTAIIKQDGYDDVLAGVSATASGGDETTYTCANMTNDEALAILRSGEPLNVILLTLNESTATLHSYYVADISFNPVSFVITLLDSVNNKTIYWSPYIITDGSPV